eukprot:TRINITY_DN275_c0_g1_i1.p1 TRINITY_DN275_c0_g1~~TRINITY_DN275_c0_g1_i1.p1  ORF type:complete len:259 (-),score=49.69 TRINITY_DN275_c0_g1_i1:33-752(-)
MGVLNILVEPIINIGCDLLGVKRIPVDYFISKALGYAMIAGGMVIKVPQIQKIRANKSVAGLSDTGLIVETIGLITAIAYAYHSAFPFSTYGETWFITLQNFIILYLIYSYSNRASSIPFVFGGLGAFAAVLLSGVLGHQALSFFQSLGIPINIASKLPQIITNYKKKSVGQLAFLTVFLQFAGTAARVFTTLKEVNDPLVLMSYLVATALNGITLAQFFIYKGSAPVATTRAKRSGKA